MIIINLIIKLQQKVLKSNMEFKKTTINLFSNVEEMKERVEEEKEEKDKKSKTRKKRNNNK